MLPVSPVAAATIPFNCELGLKPDRRVLVELDRTADHQSMKWADDGQVRRQRAALQHRSVGQFHTYGGQHGLQFVDWKLLSLRASGSPHILPGFML